MNNRKWIKLLTILLIGSVLLIGAVQRFDTIQAKKVIVTGSGGLVLGVNSGALDLNGKQLILDTDADTSITADTDDQIDIEISGSDDFIFTANKFESQTGSVIDLNGTKLDLDADADTSLTADTDDTIDWEIGGSDVYSQTATNHYFNGKILTIDADQDTTLAASVDDIVIITLGAAAGHLDVATGNLKVGNGTPGISQNGEDAYIEGVLEVDGLANFGSVISQPVNIENFGNGKTILTQVITWTAAAGTSGSLATITDGEIWFVHSVFIRTTTNFDATGDDVTFIIGDDQDVDGFITASDTELQAAFTEATGYAAGWYGIENGSSGAYTLDDGGPFVYAPSGADQTIDFLLDEASGETITAGSLTTYVIYTRIQ